MEQSVSWTNPNILILDNKDSYLNNLADQLSVNYDFLKSESVEVFNQTLTTEYVKVALVYCSMINSDLLTQLEHQAQTSALLVSIIVLDQDVSVDENNANSDSFDIAISIPKDTNELDRAIRHALSLYGLKQQVDQLQLELKLKPDNIDQAMVAKRQAIQSRYSWDSGIVRSSKSVMNTICETIKTIAPYDLNVIISGESGTGKELCARSLHFNSLRQDKPFIAQNCGALPDELLESELFGHKKGAFTGAIDDRIGLFEQANGGTVFLDEISETSSAFQIKLLRVIQEGEVRPLGSTQTKKIDVRIICATNQELESLVKQKTFRQDLYYRLATFLITLPPLRERIIDIPQISVAILDQVTEQLGKRVKGISKELIDCFSQYHWPGNIRELQNEIKRLLVVSQGDYLEAKDASSHILYACNQEIDTDIEYVSRREGTLKERIGLIESSIIKEALIRCQWNKSKVANELGLSRLGLNNKIERYGLENHHIDHEVIEIR